MFLGELDDSDEEELGRPRLTGETVLVDLDRLPPDLESTVTEFQERGLVARNAEGGRFGMNGRSVVSYVDKLLVNRISIHVVELDVGLKGYFRFHKLIWHNSKLLSKNKKPSYPVYVTPFRLEDISGVDARNICSYKAICFYEIWGYKRGMTIHPVLLIHIYMSDFSRYSYQIRCDAC